MYAPPEGELSGEASLERCCHQNVLPHPQHLPVQVPPNPNPNHLLLGNQEKDMGRLPAEQSLSFIRLERDAHFNQGQSPHPHSSP